VEPSYRRVNYMDEDTNLVSSSLDTHPGVKDQLAQLQRSLEEWGRRQECLLNQVLINVSGAGQGVVSNGRATGTKEVPIASDSNDFGCAGVIPQHTPLVVPTVMPKQQAKPLSFEEDIDESIPVSVTAIRSGKQRATHASTDTLGSDDVEAFKEESRVDKLLMSANVLLQHLRRRSCCGGVHPEERNGLQRCFARIVEAKPFEALCATVIALNCVQMTLDTNRSVREALTESTDENAEWLQTAGISFAFFYIFEWILRVGLHQIVYFVGEDWKWNVLDTVLVALACQEVLNVLTKLLVRGDEVEEASNNFTFIRIVRIVKISKAFRIVRLLRVFRELRLMLSLVLGCARSMSWGIMLILLVSFVFGICMTQGTILYLTNGRIHDPVVREDIIEYWGSVGISMNSLFMASTSGESWIVMARPLMDIHMGFYFVFLLYLLFFLIVVVNSMTGIFLDATAQNATQDQQIIIMEELRKKAMYVKRFKNIWRQLDDDNSGDVSLKEIVYHMSDPSLSAFMSNLEVDICDVVQFFEALSHDGEILVDADTFVDGCLKLKGWARSVDLYGFVQVNRKQMAQQDMLVRRCLQEVKLLRRSLKELECIKI